MENKINDLLLANTKIPLEESKNITDILVLHWKESINFNDLKSLCNSEDEAYEVLNKIYEHKKLCESAMKNSKGEPLLIWHWTYKLFDEFYDCSHFWTLKSAQDRIVHTQNEYGKSWTWPYIYGSLLFLNKILYTSEDINENFESDWLIKITLQKYPLHLSDFDRNIILGYHANYTVQEAKKILHDSQFNEETKLRIKRRYKTEEKINEFIEWIKNDLKEYEVILETQEKYCWQEKNMILENYIQQNFWIDMLQEWNHNFLAKYLSKNWLYDWVVYKNKVEDKWKESFISFSGKSIVPVIQKDCSNDKIKCLL